MYKSIVFKFFAIILIGLFYPVFGCLADGEYQINSQAVKYNGIVPCGKCVEAFPDNFDFNSVSDAKIKKGVKEAAKQHCATTSGSRIYPHCQVCHFPIMIDGIIDYVLINIIPYVTVLMLVIGGVMFYFGGAKPELLGKSKTLFKGVIIGLVLIYGAYMIVGFFLTVLGAADINPISRVFDSEKGVLTINCPIKL